jgi:hypothetical protein
MTQIENIVWESQDSGGFPEVENGRTDPSNTLVDPLLLIVGGELSLGGFDTKSRQFCNEWGGYYGAAEVEWWAYAPKGPEARTP